MQKLLHAICNISQLNSLHLSNFVMPEIASSFSSLCMLDSLRTLKITKSDSSPLFEPDQVNSSTLLESTATISSETLDGRFFSSFVLVMAIVDLQAMCVRKVIVAQIKV